MISQSVILQKRPGSGLVFLTEKMIRMLYQGINRAIMPL